MNDAERVELQHRIAHAIRCVSPAHARAVAFVLRDALVPDEISSAALAALAAAAHDDVIADALAQVRQTILLERGR